MRTFLSWLVWVGLLGACGDLTNLDAYFQVKVQGVFESPSDAGGEYEPLSATYTVESIVVERNGETLNWGNDTATVYRVASRPQMIASHKLDTAEQQLTYDRVVVTLGNDVVIKTRYDEFTQTLTDTTVTYDQAFTIAKSTDVVFLLKIKWRNIVTRDGTTDTVSRPELELVLSSN